MSSTKKDPYASEAETQALLVPDTRTAAERKLAQMMTERGADAQGAEAYVILRQIAVELLAEQPAQHLSGLAVYLDPSDGLKPKRYAPQPAQQQEPTDSMGMPVSCGKPLCSPGDHHPLCKLAAQSAPVQRLPADDTEGGAA